MLFQRKSETSETHFTAIEDFTAAIDKAVSNARASSLSTYALIDALESRVANIRHQQAMSYNSATPTLHDGRGYRRT